VLGGDPGGDAAAPVDQGLAGRAARLLPAADGLLDVGQVGGHVVAVVPHLDPLGVVDASPSQRSARSYSTRTEAQEPIMR
jgi:hypothetical protein